MSEITEAVEAKRTQIAQLQSDIETLQRAVSIFGGGADDVPAAETAAAPPADNQPTTTPEPKTTRQRHTWSAAEKEAIGKRMKAYWAKRRRAKREKTAKDRAGGRKK